MISDILPWAAIMLLFYALDIERETDSAPALIQVSLDTGKADPLYVSGIAVGNYIVSDIGLQGKILCADGDALYFAATKEAPPRFINCLPQVNRYA